MSEGDKIVPGNGVSDPQAGLILFVRANRHSTTAKNGLTLAEVADDAGQFISNVQFKPELLLLKFNDNDLALAEIVVEKLTKQGEALKGVFRKDYAANSDSVCFEPFSGAFTLEQADQIVRILEELMPPEVAKSFRQQILEKLTGQSIEPGEENSPPRGR